MSGKIYCIMGRSATGKSSVANHLKDLGYDLVVSTTTRPMREGEQEGVDYYFISEEEFANKFIKDHFIEATTYNHWHYGIDRHSLDLENHNYIAVTEVSGYHQLVENLGQDKVVPILLWIPPLARLHRAIYRELDANNDNAYKEICRRFISDYSLFDDFEKKLDKKYKFYNTDSKRTAELINNSIVCNVF